jgi:hypothetical protein
MTENNNRTSIYTVFFMNKAVEQRRLETNKVTAGYTSENRIPVLSAPFGE